MADFVDGNMRPCLLLALYCNSKGENVDRNNTAVSELYDLLDGVSMKIFVEMYLPSGGKS